MKGELELKISVVENGFVVYDNSGKEGFKCKMWAFESAKSLGQFVLEWAEENIDPPDMKKIKGQNK